MPLEELAMPEVRARETNKIGVSSCRMYSERARNDGTGSGRQDRMAQPPPAGTDPGGEEIDQTRFSGGRLVFLP